jgi:hypothetical protein
MHACTHTHTQLHFHDIKSFLAFQKHKILKW